MDVHWIKAVEVNSVEENGTLGLEIAGKEVCLYNLKGEIFATEGKCTHGDAELAQGFIVEDGLIECPLHEGTFDIRTGAALGAPCTQALQCYRTRVSDGVIFIQPQ